MLFKAVSTGNNYILLQTSGSLVGLGNFQVGLSLKMI